MKKNNTNLISNERVHNDKGNLDNYNNNVRLIPLLTYTNADLDRLIIYKENKNKAGIYR